MVARAAAPVVDWLWKLQCALNRPLLGRELAPARFDAIDGIDVVGVPAPPAASVELCVVVITHARPEACRALVDALQVALRQAGLDGRTFVIVLQDDCDADYQSARAALHARFPGRFAYYVASEHLGKPGFWFTYQTAFRCVRALGAKFTLFLQDDVTFSSNLVRDALTRFDAIEDERKAALYLCAMPDDEIDGRWIRARRVELPRQALRLTRWLDLQAFLAHERFFECLHHEVFPSPASRWARDASRSSGVGEQFTRRLFGRANVYQVRDTLVYHGESPSLMNADARAQRSLDNRPQLSARSGAKAHESSG